MAKELPYFKFEPAEWMMGRITRESSNVQIAFIRICCQFWRNSGDMTIEDAALECEENEFSTLTKKKFILTSDNCISIKFLDIQLDEMAEVSKGRSKAAKARWDKRDANALQLHNPALQNDADKIREDKIREDKRKEDKRKEEIKEKALPFSFMNSLIRLGAEKQLVTDWLKVRKTKNLTNTETAFDGFVIEFNKSDKGINDILKTCCQNSWGGFKASWKEKDSQQNESKPSFATNR